MWMFAAAFLLVFLGVAAYALWPAQEPAHEPSGRGAPAARQSDPAPRIGFGAVVGVAAGKVVNSIEDMKGGYARARGYDTMSSWNYEPDPTVPTSGVLEGANHEPEPRTQAPEVEPEPITSTKADPLGKLEALQTLYAKGLTPLDVAQLQEGDAGAIRRAQQAGATRKVIAKAMGGTYQARLAEIAAALEQGVGDA